MEKTMGLDSVKESARKYDKENQVKPFSYIKCFNVSWKLATNNWLLTEKGYWKTVAFYEIKSNIVMW